MGIAMRHMVLAALALIAAAPAAADVKAGVDAWEKGDWNRAVEEWREPAVAGDPDAQFNLGQAYKLGRGVPVDPTLAENWFRKAALQGHAQAETNYGIALFEADKKADAAPWLEKSVARFEPRGQLVLGTMLFNGDGVKRDPVRGYALMMRASAANLASAQRTLADMDGIISPADRERGVSLARMYEAQGRSLASSATTRVVERAGEPSAVPPRGAVRTAALPPSRSAAKTEAPRPPSAMATPPAKAKAVAASAKTAPVASGNWRVQLGAFRDRNNAKALWARVGTRLRGASPTYVAGGGVTRLQAGGYPNRMAAANACASAKAAGTPCVIVAPAGA